MPQIHPNPAYMIDLWWFGLLISDSTWTCLADHGRSIFLCAEDWFLPCEFVSGTLRPKLAFPHRHPPPGEEYQLRGQHSSDVFCAAPNHSTLTLLGLYSIFEISWRVTSRQGPLASLHGQEEYSKAMEQWQRLLPERLEGFEAGWSTLSFWIQSGFAEALKHANASLRVDCFLESWIITSIHPPIHPSIHPYLLSRGFWDGSVAARTWSHHSPLARVLCGASAAHVETLGAAGGRAQDSRCGRAGWDHHEVRWLKQNPMV